MRLSFCFKMSPCPCRLCHVDSCTALSVYLSFSGFRVSPNQDLRPFGSRIQESSQFSFPWAKRSCLSLYLLELVDIFWTGRIPGWSGVRQRRAHERGVSNTLHIFCTLSNVLDALDVIPFMCFCQLRLSLFVTLRYLPLFLRNERRKKGMKHN